MAKEKRDIRKQFLLDSETATKLKAVAEEKNMSENEIVFRALGAYLKRFPFAAESVNVKDPIQ